MMVRLTYAWKLRAYPCTGRRIITVGKRIDDSFRDDCRRQFVVDGRVDTTFARPHGTGQFGKDEVDGIIDLFKQISAEDSIIRDGFLHRRAEEQYGQSTDGHPGNDWSRVSRPCSIPPGRISSNFSGDSDQPRGQRQTRLPLYVVRARPVALSRGPDSPLWKHRSG